MSKPNFADYVRLIYALFDRFEQEEMATRRPGHPFTYAHKLMICPSPLCTSDASFGSKRNAAGWKTTDRKQRN